MKFSFQMIKQMHKMLPWRNTVAMTSNMNITLPVPLRKWVTGGRRNYSGLPKILQMEDGTPVKTPQDWEARRAELLQLFKKHVYGVLPKSGFTIDFKVLEEGSALNGAALRRQICITVTTEKGSSDALMALHLPASVSNDLTRKVPVILGLNFNGNHTILDDAALLPSPSYVQKSADIGLPEGISVSEEMKAKLAQMNAAGGASEQWAIQDAVAQGYGIASIYCNDFAPDNKDTWGSRVISLFDEKDFKAVGAWAFGLMRGIDYLTKDPQVDDNRLVLIGHSRLGKAAVWAGANDDRVALVISNDAGCTGSSLSRGNRGETVKSITASFPYWFSSNYASYGGHLNTLPVDQHQLLACIAPRKVYVACAENDLWADPQGSWNALMMSRGTFAIHGLDVLCGGIPLPKAVRMPKADGKALFAEGMGFHVRQGWHDVKKEDWDHYFAYMNKYLK